MFKNTSKAQRTRSRILETALQLFRDRGYDDTTMRVIAGEAGVSLGNAYYYFKSKEHLIQAFYGRTHEEHLAACRPRLAEARTLKDRLRVVMYAKLETIEPYHRFSGILFKTAADPASPLNPFSDASLPVRREATALFAEVVSGSNQKVHKSLAAELPNLLWIYHMGVVLFWIHDASPGRKRSYALVDASIELIVQLIKLAASPLIRPLTNRVLKMLKVLHAQDMGAPQAA